jgi:hypothetical protein
MSGWTSDMAAALPPDSGDASAVAGAPAVQAPNTRAQDAGWVPKTAYNYEAYMKTTKDLAAAQVEFTGEDPQLAVGGLLPQQWHSEVRTYPLHQSCVPHDYISYQ